MYSLYNLTISVLFLLAFPYFLFRAILKPCYRSGLKQKLGFISKAKREVLRSQNNIWLHAVSVGEILASLPLIELIKKNFPDYQLVISTTTETGQEIAKKEIFQARFVYFPLDIFFLAARFLHIIKPAVFIVAESEFWPNFLRKAYSLRVPIIVFNGRISASSYRRYKKAGRFFRKVLSYVSFFGMQTERDAQRIISLGADSRRVEITGNTKFDSLKKTESKSIERLIEELKLSSQDLIFLAGSTHPGEEKIVLNCFLKLRKEFSNLRLILCPRHLERLAEVEKMINQSGVPFARRTHLKGEGQKAVSVFVLDTLGELAGFYSIASVVFVGGSLVPKGGQNILEPINFGKPTVFGPYMANFQEIAELFENSKIAFRVQNEDELCQKISSLLKDKDLRGGIKDKAEQIINSYKGASARNFEFIKEYLGKEGKVKAQG